MHHDTITGTSPSRVIKYAQDKIESLELRNSIRIADIICKDVKVDQGITIDGVTQCLQKANEPAVCPPKDVGGILYQNNKLILVVRNPSLQTKKYAVVQVSHANFIANFWDRRSLKWVKIASEAFCYEPSDKNSEQ